MIACLLLVLSFKESGRLAGAYGLAVTATMGLTSGLYLVAAIRVWRWPLWKALPPVLLFLLFDLSYFGANLFKVFDGGWITLVTAAAITTGFTTWEKGREELKRKLLANRLPLESFLSDVARHRLTRVRGTAVFMTLSPEGVPPTLLHHVKHNHILHEQVVLADNSISGRTGGGGRPAGTPGTLDQGFYRPPALYGYMEAPSVPKIMRLAAGCGLTVGKGRGRASSSPRDASPPALPG